jgi:hypothetical protein
MMRRGGYAQIFQNDFFCLSTTFSMPKKLLETRASAASEVRWSTISIGSKKKKQIVNIFEFGTVPQNLGH